MVPKPSPSSLAVRSAQITTRGGEAQHQQLLDAFLTRQSERTKALYRRALLDFEAWCVEERLLSPLADIPARLNAVSRLLFSWDALTAHVTVTKYIAELNTKKAPNTVNLQLAALRSLVKVGRKLGMVQWSLDVRGPAAQNVRDVRGPPLEMVKTLMKAAEKSRKMHAMLQLLFGCGLRSVELRELRMEHLKLDGASPGIMVRGKGQSGLTLLTVSSTTAVALRRWLVERGNAPGFVFHAWRTPEKMLQGPNLTQQIQIFGAANGVKVWPHALRHSSITALLDATNGDMRSVQKFSRHKRIDTVVRYDDQRRDVGGELRKKLEGLVQGE